MGVVQDSLLMFKACYRVVRAVRFFPQVLSDEQVEEHGLMIPYDACV